MVVVPEDQAMRLQLRQIDENSWTIGNYILRRSPFPSETATWNDGTDNSSYTVEKCPAERPVTTKFEGSPYIKLIHETNTSVAAWAIGGAAVCKARFIEEGATTEATILDYVCAKKPSFKTPRLFYYALNGDRFFLFMERIPGRTLDSAWPSLDLSWRHHYVQKIADAVAEMAEWKGQKTGGVDGKHLPECYLTPGRETDYTTIEASCKELGIDCSQIVFGHLDLGPTNIIVEESPSSGEIGIIDYEISGFIPKGWIRTKTRVSAGYLLTDSASDDPVWWKRRCEEALGARGFEDFTDKYLEWRKARK